MPSTDNIEDIAASLIETPESDEDQDITEDQEDGDQEETETEDITEDTSEDEAADDDEPEMETFTVKVDGKEVSVTLDELRQGFAGQAKITQGMQENAAKRKELAALDAQFHQARAEFAQLYQAMQQGALRHPPQAPDLKELETNPQGYLRKKAAYEAEVQQFHQQQQQIAHIFQRQQHASDEARRVYLAEQVRELSGYIPDLADPEKGGAIRTDLLSAGQEYGYSEDEIAQVMDHRALRVLHDAAQYRKLQSSQKAVTEKTAKARPVLKPGAKKRGDSRRKAHEAAAQRARKTGSVEDVAASLIV